MRADYTTQKIQAVAGQYLVENSDRDAFAIVNNSADDVLISIGPTLDAAATIKIVAGTGHWALPFSPKSRVWFVTDADVTITSTIAENLRG